MKEAPQKLLTIPEAAEILRVSRRTVYELMRKGSLSSLKVGGQRRIPAAVLDRWIEERTGNKTA